MLEAWINRTDCYGAYRKGGAQYTSKTKLTPAVLKAHLAGKRTIGLHTTSPESTSRWACIDIDAHDGEREDANHAKALETAEAFRARGCDPLIEDSDGRGGRHVWVFFAEPAPTPDVYALAQDVCPEGGEAFPKQPNVNPEPGPGHYGNWVRLPGKHHKRDHWSRFWSGGDWIEWADGIAEMMEDPPLSEAPAPAADAEARLYWPPEPAERGEGTEPLPISGGGDPAHDWATIVDCLPKIGEPHISDYDDWLRVGMVIHRTKPSLMGLATWDEWSQGSPKYEADACAKKWPTFGTGAGHPTPVGIGTLVKWAGLDATAYAVERLERENPERPTSEPVGVDEEKRRRLLATCSEAMGAPIERIIQRGRERETHLYCIRVAGREAVLGGYKEFRASLAWEELLHIAFGYDMPPIDKETWQKLRRHLKACVEVDDSYEHSPEGRLAGMLAEYLSDHPADEKMDSTVMGEPFLARAHLWIHVPSFSSYLQQRRMWAPKSILSFMQGLRFTTRMTWHFESPGQKRTTRSYWGAHVEEDVVAAALSGGSPTDEPASRA